MLRKRLKSLVLLLLVFLLFTCIDPYSPGLTGYDSILVVDGLLTDENIPCEVRLYRSVQAKDSIPVPVPSAHVTITDDRGNLTTLTNSGGGIYKTDPSEFTGMAGNIYTLHIITDDGNEYISTPSPLLPVPDIDSLYYLKDEIFANNQTETQEGIRFYVDSKGSDDDMGYLRWELEETWKFLLPNPIRYTYYSDSEIYPVAKVKEECWKTQRSGDINVRFISPEHRASIQHIPLNFVVSDRSDRFTVRYSALVKQYSLSKKEYNFWNNLKKVNESGGDIFDSQPYAVISNISNIDDPDEKVLGYFKVSAVKQKRIYISPGDLFNLGLPFYKYNCLPIYMAPEDYPRPNPFVPFMTWDALYAMYAGDPRFVFVEPTYNPVTMDLSKLVFSKVECSVCEEQGTSQKPDFWTE